MSQSVDLEVQNLEFLKIEDAFIDRHTKVFDTLLLHGSIIEVKEKLRLLKYQGIDIHNLHQSIFHMFATEQTLR